jgi:SAM-dependent methyltransferase
MTDDRARRFFDAIAPRYDRVYAPPRDASRARMARVLELLPPKARILDLGVGTGRELSALLDAGHAPIGLDFSPEMLALCNRRARPIPTVLASFWEPLPFDAASFDAALALHGSLAHPPDDEALLRLGDELARVLAPGGVFVAEMPARAWLDTLEGDGDPERHAHRLDATRFEYRDAVRRVSIEARILDDADWAAALGPALAVEVLASGPFERLVVGRRMR